MIYKVTWRDPNFDLRGGYVWAGSIFEAFDITEKKLGDNFRLFEGERTSLTFDEVPQEAFRLNFGREGV